MKKESVDSRAKLKLVNRFLDSVRLCFDKLWSTRGNLLLSSVDYIFSN